MIDARNVGVKKSMTLNSSMGMYWFLTLATYALVFWYGTRLTIEEPENYSPGNVMIVSIICELQCHYMLAYRRLHIRGSKDRIFTL